MEKFIADASTAYWWLTVVGVAILVNLLSAVLMSKLSRWREQLLRGIATSRSAKAETIRDRAQVLHAFPETVPFLLEDLANGRWLATLCIAFAACNLAFMAAASHVAPLLSWLSLAWSIAGAVGATAVLRKYLELSASMDQARQLLSVRLSDRLKDARDAIGRDATVQQG